ncbi:MAG TPA: hypothetical protein EYG80_00525 [Flavobacteriaceae bacterium]|nr:hypothetical protein [Flavobacteriaceae bacterium]
MLHAFNVHFAVSLPLLATVLSILFFITKKDFLWKSSTIVLIFGAIAAAIAFFTGNSDGDLIYEFLTKKGQDALTEHYDFVFYVLPVLFITMLVKIYACYKKNIKIEMIGLGLLILSSILIIYQGRLGGLLVYSEGMMK